MSLTFLSKKTVSINAIKLFIMKCPLVEYFHSVTFLLKVVDTIYNFQANHLKWKLFNSAQSLWMISEISRHTKAKILDKWLDETKLQLFKKKNNHQNLFLIVCFELSSLFSREIFKGLSIAVCYELYNYFSFPVYRKKNNCRMTYPGVN